MKVIKRSALVNYSASDMYSLVMDFESYPQFMPGCVGAVLLRSGEGWIEARLDLTKAGFMQSIVTRNTLYPPEKMEIAQLEGPFSHFSGQWQFDTLPEDNCRVNFYLEFAFSSRLLGFAAGKLFEQVASEQVVAICDRAKSIYE